MDLEMTYPNAITSTVLLGVRIPAILKSDREAMQICLRTANEIDKENPRVVRIADTMHLEHIFISEAMLGEARQNPSIIIEGEPAEMSFDEHGNLW
jgi:hypothetical protein